MEFLGNAQEVVVFIVAVVTCISTIGSTIYAVYNKIKAMIASKENSVKDIATAAIIEVEKLLDAGKDALKDAGIDTGAFKYASVISKIQTACSELKLKFDEIKWDTFIESQVAVLNATKPETEETL